MNRVPLYRVSTASAIRWAVVLIHTSLVGVAASCLATSPYPIERLFDMGFVLFLFFVIDFPIGIVEWAAFILMTTPRFVGHMPSPQAASVAFFAVFALLGGLQYYWLTGALVRHLHVRHRMVVVTRKRIAVCIFVGVFVLAAPPSAVILGRHVYDSADESYAHPTAVFRGDSRDLRKSTVVPTTDTPIPGGDNAIWCATFQVAWDRLKSDVVGEPVNVAGAEAISAHLNQSEFPTDDLAPESYYAAAGFAEDGIADRIQREMEQRFQKDCGNLNAPDNAILAYAYLRAAIAFVRPYFQNPSELVFKDSEGHGTQVSSFGIWKKEHHSYNLERQLDVLYLRADDKNSMQPTEFAVDLCRYSSPNQVVLACIPRQGTLVATLDDLDRKVAAYATKENQPHVECNRLLVPNLNWSITHRFKELEGTQRRLLNQGFEHLYMTTACEVIDFRLDRSGVALESKAIIAAKSELPVDLIFNRPFLICVKKRGSEHPFFLMWVGNAELLCKPENQQETEMGPSNVPLKAGEE